MPVEYGRNRAADEAPVDTAHHVALEVLRHGPLPRSVLARRLGLSAGSLTRVSRPLLGSGLLVEREQVTDPATRRPTRPLDVVTSEHRFVGVAVTGDAAYGVLTDLRMGVLAENGTPLPDASPTAVVDAVGGLVDELRGPDRTVPDGVGIALGGYVAVDGRVTRADFLGWRTPVDLGPLLAARLGVPVTVGNDLACLTRAEHWFGEGREHADFAVLTVGAGVGYGLVLGDHAVQSTDTDLQLLGHLPLSSGGPRCLDGHQGCATALLTVGALLAAAEVSLGRRVGWSELLDVARDGDPAARRLVDDAAASLGRLISIVANTTGIARVLLAGEGVGLAEVGWDVLVESVASFRDPRARPVQLVVRAHDFHDWARGAAAAAVQEFAAGPRWLSEAGG